MSDALLKSVGGRKQVLMGSDPNDPTNVTWNFGVAPKTEAVRTMLEKKTSFYERFPKLVGKWDGKTTVNHWDSINKVLGDKATDLIQMQPRGTCGGRAGSFTMDALQCILIAAGKNAKFHRVSHAAVYYVARKLYNMLSGSWTDDNNDGVASGSVPKALEQMGIVQREEDTDANWYGNGSDDLACKLGCGLLPDIASTIIKDGADTLLTSWQPVKSAQELADGIAAGGIGLGSDGQGFTMNRDKDGFCRAMGTWQHYQVRTSVGVFNGRKGFGYNQSWGKETPTGPLLVGHPGNCFGVDFDVQDRIIKSGDWSVAFAFPLWDLEDDKVNVNWKF